MFFAFEIADHPYPPITLLEKAMLNYHSKHSLISSDRDIQPQHYELDLLVCFEPIGIEVVIEYGLALIVECY